MFYNPTQSTYMFVNKENFLKTVSEWRLSKLEAQFDEIKKDFAEYKHKQIVVYNDVQELVYDNWCNKNKFVNSILGFFGSDFYLEKRTDDFEDNYLYCKQSNRVWQYRMLLIKEFIETIEEFECCIRYFTQVSEKSDLPDKIHIQDKFLFYYYMYPEGEFPKFETIVELFSKEDPKNKSGFRISDFRKKINLFFKKSHQNKSKGLPVSQEVLYEKE